jgi:hypothetical protein
VCDIHEYRAQDIVTPPFDDHKKLPNKTRTKTSKSSSSSTTKRAGDRHHDEDLSEEDAAFLLIGGFFLVTIPLVCVIFFCVRRRKQRKAAAAATAALFGASGDLQNIPATTISAPSSLTPMHDSGNVVFDSNNVAYAQVLVPVSHLQQLPHIQPQTLADLRRKVNISAQQKQLQQLQPQAQSYVPPLQQPTSLQHPLLPPTTSSINSVSQYPSNPLIQNPYQNLGPYQA